MPGRQRAAIRRYRPGPLAAVLALSLVACSDDEAPDADEEDPAPATTVEFTDLAVTTPPELLPSADPDFIDDIVADGNVTAAELEDAYQRFIACLVEGGGSGSYAYDLSLETGLALDWSLADPASGVSPESLEASCSRDYLGDLVGRYEDASPDDPGLAERRRDSIIRCVEAFDPAVAASIPDVVTVDTSGAGPDAVSLQLDPAALGAGPDVATDVGRCIGSLGAPWTGFG